MPRTVVLCFLAAALSAAPPPSAPVEITARITKEDGAPEVIATVTQDHKPVANVGVTFLLHRSFGDLTLGQDTTLDDGTAVAPFPPQLTPDHDGSWTFQVHLTSPDALAGQGQEIRIEAPKGTESLRPEVESPRALWGRHAPWSVLITVLVLVGSAWSAFAYAAFQLFHIKKGETDVPQP